MPRLLNSLPKYRKHRASGQAVVTLSGRDIYLGPHGTKASRIEYDRLVGEWLANGRTVAQPETEITVSELCSRYLKFAKSYYRKNGKCTGVVPGIKATIKYLATWYGKQPAAEFGPVALKALRQRMVADGHSRRYVNDHCDRLKRLFKWGAAEQLIPEATYRSLALVEGLRAGRTEARETAPILPVDDAVVDATAQHLPEVVRDMVALQLATGARPAEITILRPCDLDRSADVWLYRPHSHKTEHHGRERVIFIGPQGQAILLKYLARGSDDYCFRPRDSEAKRRAAMHEARKTPKGYGNTIGTNRKRRPKRKAGDHYSVDSYRRAIARACDKAFPAPEGMGESEKREWRKLHRWAPNRLRHSAGTRVRKEFGLEHAQVALGHSSADVTQIYAERDLQKGVEVARAIG